ncbi:cytochrome C [Sulfurimonas sp.]
MKRVALFVFLFYNLHANESGSLLFHGNCVTCHYELQDKSAPSMLHVRERYLQAFPKKEDFVAYMSTWVLHPNEEGSIMQDAIKKYELMPQLAFEKEVLEEITSYIYETDFKKNNKNNSY